MWQNAQVMLGSLKQHNMVCKSQCNPWNNMTWCTHLHQHFVQCAAAISLILCVACRSMLQNLHQHFVWHAAVCFSTYINTLCLYTYLPTRWEMMGKAAQHNRGGGEEAKAEWQPWDNVICHSQSSKSGDVVGPYRLCKIDWRSKPEGLLLQQEEHRG